MTIDMRSNSMEELLKLEQRVMASIKEAVVEENRRWRSEALTVEMKLIGDRPAGEIPDEAKVVQAARRSLGVLGQQVKAVTAARGQARSRGCRACRPCDSRSPGAAVKVVLPKTSRTRNVKMEIEVWAATLVLIIFHLIFTYCLLASTSSRAPAIRI